MAEETSPEVENAGQQIPQQVESDVQQWLVDLNQLLWGGDAAKRLTNRDAIGLQERLLALGTEMGRLGPDAKRKVKEGSNATFPYHSIYQISDATNRLQAKWRVRITSSMVEIVEPFAGTRGVRIRFTATNVDNPSEAEFWDWIDDGNSLRNAGAYTEKYGIMRHFKVGDGEDPDFSENRDGSGRSGSRGGGSRTQAAGGSIGSGGSEQGQAGDDRGSAQPQASGNGTPDADNMTAAVYYLCEEAVLPKRAMWAKPKVMAVAQAWEAKKKGNKLSEDEAKFASGMEYVFEQLSQAHLKDHGGDEGKGCGHILTAQNIVKVGRDSAIQNAGPLPTEA